MHFKKLSGAATAHVSLAAAGDNQKTLISTLNGKGDFDFKNGMVEGIDFEKIAKLVQSHSTDVGVNDGETKFIDLTGTFTIAKGIASNNDLKMKGAVVQATGQGTVDLPKKYIQYRATPALVISRTGANPPPGLAIPVDIKGPFSNIHVVPDFASVVSDIVKNPSAAKTTLKNIRDNLKGLTQGPAALKSLLQGGPFAAPSSAPATAPAPLPVQPENQRQAPQESQESAPAP
jgi:AsmA protein